MTFAKRAAALLTASLMIVGTMTACGNNNQETPSSSGEGEGKVYHIVADNAFAPFDFMDPDTMEYTGIDMDLLAAIAEDQGFEYVIDNCGWDAALSSLGSGQADGMIAGMTITEERQESYDFSDPYFEGGQIMFVKADSDITSIEDLQGLQIRATSSAADAMQAWGAVPVSMDMGEVYEGLRSGLGADAEGFIRPLPGGEKFRVDLKGANARFLVRAGLSPAHIALCSACTACRPDLFWSHRKLGARRGSMASVIQLL